MSKLSLDEIIENFQEEQQGNDLVHNEHVPLELSDDIYCICFIKFLIDKPLLHKELLLKSVIAFIMQIVLISLIIWESFATASFGTLDIY